MRSNAHAAGSSRGLMNSVSRLCLVLAIGLSPACSSKPAPSRMDLAVNSGEAARATLEATVTDPSRRKRALELFDQFVSIEVAFVERERATRDKLPQLNADYDAQAGAFYAVYEELDLARSEALEALLVPLEALEALLTREEWLALTDSLETGQGNWSKAQ